MALIKCRECGSEASEWAKTCPTCGAKDPDKTSHIIGIVMGVIVVVGIFIAIFAGAL